MLCFVLSNTLEGRCQLPTQGEFDNFYDVDLQGGYAVGSITKRTKKRGFDSPKYNFKDEVPGLDRLQLDTIIKLNGTTYDRTLSRKFELNAKIENSTNLTKQEKFQIKAALNSARKISLKVDNGQRLAFKYGTSAIDHGVDNLTSSIVSCGMKQYCDKKALLVAEVLEYNNAKYIYELDRSLDANVLLKFKQLVIANGQLESSDSLKIIVNYTRPTVVAVKTETISPFTKKLLKSKCEMK
jgi:hypothetical protein